MAADFPLPLSGELLGGEVALDVDISRARPFDRRLYGFNSQLAAMPFRYGDGRFASLVAELAPGNLRFPGGTVANFYEWRTDDFANVPETAYPWLKWTLRKFRAKEGKYGFADYARLVERIGAAPVLVINVNHWSPADAVDWVAEAKARGLGVRNVELGNEVYFKGQFTERTRDVAAYIRVTREFASALAGAHPEVRTAVCVPPFDRPEANWERRWHRPLAEARHYDAIACHLYVGGQGVGVEESRHSTLVELLSPGRAVDELLALARALYGDRPVWLTEWNLGLEAFREHGHTALAALFTASLFSRAVERRDRIELSCYHQIAGGTFGCLEMTDEGKRRKFPAFAVWQLAGFATAGATKTAGLTFSPPGPEAWPFAPITGNAFLAEDEIRLFIVNRLPIERRATIELDGRPSRATGEMRSFSGEALLGEPPVPFEGSGISRAPVDGGGVILPPYSVSVVTLER